MNKQVSTIVKVLAGVLIGVAAVSVYHTVRTGSSPFLEAPAVPSVPSAPSTGTVSVDAVVGKQQARDALMALPELKVWSERIAQSSGGKIRGALVEYDPTPKLVNGKKYWQLSFVENGAVAAHSWDSFLVEVGGSTILVEDYNSDKQLTLAQWRATKRPMERTKAEADS